MDKSAVTNFLQKSMQTLFAGISGAVSSPKDFVPAIAPIPVDDVDNSYASGDLKSYKPEKKLKEKKVEGHDALMKEGYTKKSDKPSNTTSFTTLVLGFLTFNTCLRVGIVSKNCCILSYCWLVRDSTHFLDSSIESEV